MASRNQLFSNKVPEHTDFNYHRDMKNSEHGNKTRNNLELSEQNYRYTSYVRGDNNNHNMNRPKVNSGLYKKPIDTPQNRSRIHFENLNERKIDHHGTEQREYEANPYSIYNINYRDSQATSSSNSRTQSNFGWEDSKDNQDSAWNEARLDRSWNENFCSSQIDNKCSNYKWGKIGPNILSGRTVSHRSSTPSERNSSFYDPLQFKNYSSGVNVNVPDQFINRYDPNEFSNECCNRGSTFGENAMNEVDQSRCNWPHSSVRDNQQPWDRSNICGERIHNKVDGDKTFVGKINESQHQPDDRNQLSCEKLNFTFRHQLNDTYNNQYNLHHEVHIHRDSSYSRYNQHKINQADCRQTNNRYNQHKINQTDCHQTEGRYGQHKIISADCTQTNNIYNQHMMNPADYAQTDSRYNQHKMNPADSRRNDNIYNQHKINQTDCHQTEGRYGQLNINPADCRQTDSRYGQHMINPADYTQTDSRYNQHKINPADCRQTDSRYGQHMINPADCRQTDSRYNPHKTKWAADYTQSDSVPSVSPFPRIDNVCKNCNTEKCICFQRDTLLKEHESDIQPQSVMTNQEHENQSKERGPINFSLLNIPTEKMYFQQIDNGIRGKDLNNNFTAENLNRTSNTEDCNSVQIPIDLPLDYNLDINNNFHVSNEFQISNVDQSPLHKLGNCNIQKYPSDNCNTKVQCFEGEQKTVEKSETHTWQFDLGGRKNLNKFNQTADPNEKIANIDEKATCKTSDPNSAGKNSFSNSVSCIVNTCNKNIPSFESVYGNSTRSSDFCITDFSFLKCPPPPLPSTVVTTPGHQQQLCLTEPEIVLEPLKPPWTQPRKLKFSEQHLFSGQRQTQFVCPETKVSSGDVSCGTPTTSVESKETFVCSAPSQLNKSLLKPELLWKSETSQRNKSLQISSCQQQLEAGTQEMSSTKQHTDIPKPCNPVNFIHNVPKCEVPRTTMSQDQIKTLDDDTVQESTNHEVSNSLINDPAASSGMVSESKIIYPVKNLPPPPHELLKMMEHNSNSAADLSLPDANEKKGANGSYNLTKSGYVPKPLNNHRPWEFCSRSSMKDKPRIEHSNLKNDSNLTYTYHLPGNFSAPNSYKQLNNPLKQSSRSFLSNSVSGSRKRNSNSTSGSGRKRNSNSTNGSGKRNAAFFRPWIENPTGKKNITEARRKRKLLPLKKRSTKRCKSSVKNNNSQLKDQKLNHRKSLKSKVNKHKKSGTEKVKISDNNQGVLLDDACSKSSNKKKYKRRKSSATDKAISLGKDLSTSVLDLKPVKLSRIANPHVSTKSSGLTSVVNGILNTPNLLKCNSAIKNVPVKNECEQKSIESEQKIFTKSFQTLFPQNVELYQLGTGHKTLLKPLEMGKFGVHTKALKSSLNLNSLKNMTKDKEEMKLLQRYQSHGEAAGAKDKELCPNLKKIAYKNLKSKAESEKIHQIESESEQKQNINEHKLTSFHPKLRHKQTARANNWLFNVNINKMQNMPKLSVAVEKCDKYLNNEKSVSIKPIEKDEQYIPESKHLNSKGHPDSTRTDSQLKDVKVSLKLSNKAHVKDSELEQNGSKKLFQPPKLKPTGIVKRGRFIMSTPTTFVIKRAKTLKSRIHKETSANEETSDNDDPLTKACNNAKECLLKRSVGARCNQFEPSSKRPKYSSLTYSSSVNDMEDSMNYMKTSKDNSTKSLSTAKDHKVSELTVNKLNQTIQPVDTESQILSNLLVPSVSDMTDHANQPKCIQTKTEKAFEKQIPDETTSVLKMDRSSSASPSTSCLTTCITSYKTAFFSNSENRSTDCSSEAVSSKFTISNIIDSLVQETNNVTADAQIYHIESKAHETLGESSVYQNTSSGDQVGKKDVHKTGAIKAEDGSTSIISPFEGKQEGLPRNMKVNTSISQSESTQGNEIHYGEEIDLGCKPFWATPLTGVGKAQSTDTDSSCLNFADSHTEETPEVNNVNQCEVISECKKSDSLDSTHQFERQIQASPLSFNDQSLHDLVMAENIDRDSFVDATDIEGEKFVSLQQDCNRNVFEDIIDDFMQDEAFMNCWPEQSVDICQEKVSSEYKEYEIPIVQKLECIDENIEEKYVYKKEVLPFNAQDKIERVCIEGDIMKTNRDKGFVSSRTPVNARVYRRRKYVKRFPNPMPRAKPKERTNDTEKDLYEDAKQFLGDFDENTKRTCRIRGKAIDKTEIAGGKQAKQKSIEHKFVELTREMGDPNITDSKEGHQSEDSVGISDITKISEISAENSICIPKDSDSEKADLRKQNESQSTETSGENILTKNANVASNSTSIGHKLKIPVLKIKKSPCWDQQEVLNKEPQNSVQKEVTGVEDGKENEDKPSNTYQRLVKLLRCSMCGSIQKSKFLLLLHYKNVHGSWWCAKCNRHFMSVVCIIWAVTRENLSLGFPTM